LNTKVSPTLSFIVPALNEQRNIGPTVEQIITAAGDRLTEYEIVLVDDHSTDTTGSIMDALARANSRVRVIHNAKNLGLGGAYKQGIKEARFNYVMGVWGDNSMPASSLIPILEQLGTSDIVMSYMPNLREIKSPFRFVGSRAYTSLLNILFGLKLRYYNGFTIHRSDLLKSIDISSNGFGFQAEIILKLLKAGHSYTEVGVPGIYITARSKALRIKNLISIVATIVHLIKELRGFHPRPGQS
jgi:dolichol-phosphate mannosyltransferase